MGATEAPRGPCRKTLPAVEEGWLRRDARRGLPGELSVSQKDSEETQGVSRNFGAERRCSKRDGEGRGQEKQLQIGQSTCRA